jgi:putative ABC transport system permease protein
LGTYVLSALKLVIAGDADETFIAAQIEDDYREIGVMKALGLRVADIKRIYLATYAVIAATGSLFGFALALALHDALLANIRLYMGESANAALAPLLGLIGVVLVFLAIMVYVNNELNRFRSISPVEAIRFGSAQKHAAGLRWFNLSRNRVFSTNVFLGLRDVLARKKLYATMLDDDASASYVVLTTRAFRVTMPDGSEQRMTVCSRPERRANTAELTTLSSAGGGWLLPNRGDMQPLSCTIAYRIGREYSESIKSSASRSRRSRRSYARPSY